MKHPNFCVHTAALGAAVAAICAAAPAWTAVPGIVGANGPQTAAFLLDAAEGYSSQPDGASVYSWGYGCASAPTGYAPAAMTAISCGTMQIPGPTLIVNENDVVTVTLINNLPVAAGPTSILFPGFDVSTTVAGTQTGTAGVLTREAPSSSCDPTTHVGCNTVTYTFTAKGPGTYAYYSGTQGDLQVEMGLYGAVIVLPNATDASISSCKRGPFSLAAAAYKHPQSCYDREYLFELAEMQSSIHDEALAQKQACEGAIAANPTATCPLISAKTEPYHPNYFLVNGRSMPDDMDASFAPMYPQQPYNGNPHMHPNELVLIREIGQGRIQHPLHIHGNHARVLARDGNLLLAANDKLSPLAGGVPRLAGPLIFTFPSVSGQAVDAIFTWTGKGLNWDVYGHTAAANIPCVPDANGYYTSMAGAPNYGEYCADHNKTIPITPPDPQIVANGLWYGGTPYLGLSESAALGFPSTPLPPGTAKQNQSAGYAYMWHSHDEREITTNDVFPGGMMMMLVIDPPSAPIDEAK
ncbi:MAG: Multicopper oxidase type 3 [Gammaproteobacteria bacterium]|nr:Multicopper oxidase type 3 [Gammaproteobacteria bacterium]